MTTLMPDVEVQTRADNGETRFFDSVKKAFGYADENRNVWKISWSDGTTHERIRMVRESGGNWRYEPMDAQTIAASLGHNVFDNPELDLKETRKPH